MRLSDIHVGDLLPEFGGSDEGIDCRWGFPAEMKHLCGKIFAVRDISGEEIIPEDETLLRRDNEGYYWYLSADMLEPFAPISSFDDFEDVDLSQFWRFPMKLEDIRIGDTIRVRQWDDMVAEFGLDDDGDIKTPSGFLQDMANLCGQTFEVIEFGPLIDGAVRVITSPLTWSILTPEVFEPVVEDSPDQFDFVDLSEYLE